jgi:lysophospholipase L1-like esterase
MALHRFLIILLALIAGVVAIKHFSATKEPLKPFRSDGVVLAFGDSLTYGSGASPDQSYPAQLERLINRKVINAGVPGERSAEGLKRLRTLLQNTHPDLLILCHGGNDILKEKDFEAVHKNLEQMILLAHSQNIEVVLIAVPQFGILQLTPPPLYAELAETYRLAIEKEILADILHDNRYKSDLIHPNELGYRKMAEAIEKLLQNRYRFEKETSLKR